MTIFSQIKREWQIIANNAWLKAMLVWVPLGLSFFLWAIFSSGTARDLPIGIVDLDHSEISRSLIQYYDASPTLSINKSYTSVNLAKKDLRTSGIYALIVIPGSLEKNTLLGHSPEVTVFYNGQYLLIGKLIASAILQAQGTFVASLETIKHMSTGTPKVLQAFGQAVPIRQQITPLFNANNHYGQFLVSALIPTVWQIIIMATMILAITAENNQQGLFKWLGKNPATNIITKMSAYTLLFWLQGIVYIVMLYSVLGWPMHGSWTILIFSQLLLVMACQSIACLFFFISLDASRSMSLTAGFAAPAFAFVGITFPVTDMPALAQFWRSLLPVSHYIEIQLQQVNYGTKIGASGNNMIVLLFFGIALFFAIMLAKNQILKNQSQGIKQ